MMRRPCFVGLCLAALAGCGDHRLTGSGHVRVQTSDAARAAIELPGDVRLDGEVRPGRITGACRVARSEVGGSVHYRVLVALDTNSPDGLRSVTVMGESDPGGAGVVEARFTSGLFRSIEACLVDLAYVDDAGSVTLEATDCPLDAGDGRSGTADVHLELHGCRVTVE